MATTWIACAGRSWESTWHPWWATRRCVLPPWGLHRTQRRKRICRPWRRSWNTACWPGPLACPQAWSIRLPLQCARGDGPPGAHRRPARLYATHIRSEDLALWGAIAEAVDVGERSGCRVEISHLKLGGVRNWGRAPELLAFLDRARERGVDVAWDQYPYVAWGSSLIDYLPHWVAADGRERLAERLLDAAVRRAIRAEIEEEVGNGRHPLCAAPWDTVRIALVGSAANRHHEGRTIAQIAASEGRDPLEVVFDLLAAERGAVKTLVVCVDEGDIRTILRHPLTAVVTDGRAVAPYGVLGQGMIHPRYYGAFPRVLARYVRDEKLLTLESAIHRMTLMPARRIGLHDRGRIAPGFAADLTIFDPATIQDRATFEQPHEYPAGIAWVILGGNVVVEQGEHTGRMCGHVLRRGGR